MYPPGGTKCGILRHRRENWTCSTNKKGCLPNRGVRTAVAIDFGQGDTQRPTNRQLCNGLFRAKPLAESSVPRLPATAAAATTAFVAVAAVGVAFGTSPANCFFVKNATSEVFAASLASLQGQVGHVGPSAALE